MKQLKKWGLVAAAIGASVIAAPVTLPAIVVTAGGYLGLAGAIAVAISSPLPAKMKKLFL